MKYDFFIFDWDGCLAKTLEVWLQTYREACEKRGLQPTDREIASHFGDWRAAEKLGAKDIDAYNAELMERGTERLKTVSLYPGAKDLLQTLQGKPVALLSATPRDLLMQQIVHNKLEALFTAVITGDDVKAHKPDPEGIFKALKAIGGAPDTAIMVGDSRKDLGAAQNAGIDSLLVYPAEHTIFYDLEELKTYNPKYIAGSFAEAKQTLLAKSV